MPALLLLAAIAMAPRSDIFITVDTPAGATISGQRTFRVTVQSPEPINQVEFYVGNDLQGSETSTPYLFQFDSIQQPDGDVQLKFKAYDDTNKTNVKTLLIHIDNNLAAGAPFHVKAGQDALTGSDWPTAVDQGRIALKIDPKNNDARLVLARAYLGERVFDKAEQSAQEAIDHDNKDDAAYQMLAGIELQRAFTTFAKEGADREDVLNTISNAFQSAVKNRRSSLDLEADAYGTPTPATLLPYADAMLREERYSAVVDLLQKPLSNDPKNLAFANRIAYAELRSGHYPETIGTLNGVKAFGNLDAYSDALLALADVQTGHNDDADKAIQDAVQIDPDNLGVRTAQAFIALKRNKNDVLANIANDLAKDQGQKASVNYFLMSLADRMHRYSDARKYFETAALAEPAYPDIYIEQGNYSIDVAQAKGLSDDDKQHHYKVAEMYFRVALGARPEAVDALCGLSVVYMLEKDMQNAARFARAAVAAAPNVAAGHFTLAAVDTLTAQTGDAQSEMKQATTLDAGNLEGVELPKALDVWRYLNTGGRIPVISAPQ